MANNKKKKASGKSRPAAGGRPQAASSRGPTGSPTGSSSPGLIQQQVQQLLAAPTAALFSDSATLADVCSAIMHLCCSREEQQQLCESALHLKLPHLLAKLLDTGDSSRWLLDPRYRSAVSSALAAGTIMCTRVAATQAEISQYAAVLEESGVLQAAAAAQEQVAVVLQQQLRDLKSASRPSCRQRDQAQQLLLTGHSLLVFWDHCATTGATAGSSPAVTPPALHAAHLANVLFEGSDLYCAERLPCFTELAMAALHAFQAAALSKHAGGGDCDAAAVAMAAREQQSAAAAATAAAQPLTARRYLTDKRVLQLLLTLLVLDAHRQCSAGAHECTSPADSSSSSTAAQTAPSAAQAAAAAATADECGLESLSPLLEACQLMWRGLSLPASTLPLFTSAWSDVLYNLQEAEQLPPPSPGDGSNAGDADSGSSGSGSSGSGSSTSNAGRQASQAAPLPSAGIPGLLAEILLACVVCISTGDDPNLATLGCEFLDTVMRHLPLLLTALAAHNSSTGSTGSSNAGSAGSGEVEQGCRTLTPSLVSAAAGSLQLWALGGLPAALEILDQGPSNPTLTQTQQVLSGWMDSMLASCTQLLQQQTPLLDAAAATALEAGGVGTSSSSSSGCEEGGGSVAMHALAPHLAMVHNVLAMLAHLSDAYPLTDATWNQHSAAVCRALEQLARTLGRAYTTLASSGSSRGPGGSDQQGVCQEEGEQLQRAATACVVVFDALGQTLVHLLAERDVGDSPFTAVTCCCTSHGLEERHALASLAASYLKLCGTFGQAASRWAKTQAVAAFAGVSVDIAALLSRDLEEGHSLAAVRAAAAPWMVLLGRQLMLAAAQLPPILAQASQAALAAGQGAQQGPAGGCLDCECGSLLSALLDWVRPAAGVVRALHEDLQDCWTGAAAAQYPDQEQQQDQGSNSSSGGGSNGGSVAAGCVLLDGLDSWSEGPLIQLALKLAPAHGTVSDVYDAAISSGAACGANGCEPAEASSSSSSSSRGSSARSGGRQAAGWSEAVSAAAAGQGAIHVRSLSHALTLVLQSGHLEGLPQLLHAAGSSLCSQLAVPWFCNNPDCRSLSGASELRLVGGHGCVCGGCTVARYCGRACQRAHWKQHKPVCRALAARAATQAGPAGS